MQKSHIQIHILNFFASCENFLFQNPDERNLHNAVKHLQYGKCKELINKGIDINFLDMNGNSVLKHLIHHKDPTAAVEIATLLCSNGIDLETRSQNCQTPMEECLDLGNIQIVEVLLEYGAHTEYLQPGPLIDICLRNNMSLLNLFINHAEKHNLLLPHFVEKTLQYLIANHHSNVFDRINQLTIGTCKLWTNEVFWKKCSEVVIIDIVRSLATLFKDYDIVVWERESLGELVHLALDQGHYETVASLSDSVLIMRGKEYIQKIIHTDRHFVYLYNLKSI